MAKHKKDKSFELLYIDGIPEDDPDNKLLDNLVLDTRMAYKNYKNFSYYNILEQDLDDLDEQIELNKLSNKETPIKNAKIIVDVHGDENGYISQDASPEILYVIFQYLNENKHVKTMEINLVSCYGATKSTNGRDILQDLQYQISEMFPNIDFFFQKKDKHYQTDYALIRNKRTKKVTNMSVKAKLREYYHIKNGKMVNFGDRQFTNNKKEFKKRVNDVRNGLMNAVRRRPSFNYMQQYFEQQKKIRHGSAQINYKQINPQNCLFDDYYN